MKKLCSMTGFARTSGFATPYRWAWEIKTVNSKGLDLRLRLPPGLEGVEAKSRELLGKRLTRGACYANLTATREVSTAEPRLNRSVLLNLIAALHAISQETGLPPVSLDALVGVRGVIDVGEAEEDEATLAVAQAAMLDGLERAVDGLATMREQEGAALSAIMTQKLDRIEALSGQADACPARQPPAIKAKLAQAVAQILEIGRFDEARLHQEAALLAAKADIREELDRLFAHVAAARKLLSEGGPIGRKLDFLAQELGRESNTLCAKSNDSALTAIGLELKVEIEQFREQAQNIE